MTYEDTTLSSEREDEAVLHMSFLACTAQPLFGLAEAEGHWVMPKDWTGSGESDATYREESDGALLLLLL